MLMKMLRLNGFGRRCLSQPLNTRKMTLSVRFWWRDSVQPFWVQASIPATKHKKITWIALGAGFLAWSPNRGKVSSNRQNGNGGKRQAKNNERVKRKLISYDTTPPVNFWGKTLCHAKSKALKQQLSWGKWNAGYWSACGWGVFVLSVWNVWKKENKVDSLATTLATVT